MCHTTPHHTTPCHARPPYPNVNSILVLRPSRFTSSSPSALSQAQRIIQADSRWRIDKMANVFSFRRGLAVSECTSYLRQQHQIVVVAAQPHFQPASTAPLFLSSSRLSPDPSPQALRVICEPPATGGPGGGGKYGSAGVGGMDPVALALSGMPTKYVKGLPLPDHPHHPPPLSS